MPRRPAHGFSLIELLVVVSIVALLVALVLPSLRGARSAAKRVACQSNLRQQGVAWHTYAADFNGFGPYQLVYVPGTQGATYPGPDADTGEWLLRLAPYVNGPPVSTLSRRAGLANSADRRIPVFQCPETWGLGPYRDDGHSYGANAYVVSDQSSAHYLSPHPLSVIRQASKLVLVGDAYIYVMRAGNQWYSSLHYTGPESGIPKKHDDGLNILFADGHTNFFASDPDTMIAQTSDPSIEKDAIYGIRRSPTATVGDIGVRFK